MQDKILKATDQFFAQFEPQEVPDLPPVPRDYYTEYAKQYRKLDGMNFPNGSSGKVLINANEVIRTLKQAYLVAKERAERLANNGDTSRAQMVIDQYMNENFMPAIEAIVRTNSADELLNSKESIDALDEYVLTPNGSGKGFTRSFVQSLYNEELGGTIAKSDMEVRHAVEEIKELAFKGQVRSAVGKATKLLQQIDMGAHQADEDDYALLLKVASR